MRHIAGRGMTPYCPMYLRPRWHLRAPRGPVPLFTGYVFVSCDPVVELIAVRYCPGVLQPVSQVEWYVAHDLVDPDGPYVKCPPGGAHLLDGLGQEQP